MSRSPLSTLDVVSWVMDRPDRPLDFTLILHSTKLPDAEALRAGARSALNRYPVTASTTDGADWIRRADTAPDFVAKWASSETAARELLEEWIDTLLDLRTHTPARQLLIAQHDSRSSILATRFHHAAADGRSAALWLTHQFQVAGGSEPPVGDSYPFEPPSLRHSLKPDRVSRRRVREPLWHRPGPRSRSRRWRTIQFGCGDLRRRIREHSAFTYNDALAAIALQTCMRWNRAHSRAGAQVALWLPVEIRRAPPSAFGNGTSRVRVPAPFEIDDPFRTKCQRVHAVISAAMRSGEWSVPDEVAVLRLPPFLMAPLLRGYLNRPWADTGSTAFSHVEHTNRRLHGIAVDRIECVGPLHRRHACAIYGVTRHDSTWLTFTYDPALLSQADIDALSGLYQDQIRSAERELTPVLTRVDPTSHRDRPDNRDIAARPTGNSSEDRG